MYNEPKKYFSGWVMIYEVIKSMIQKIKKALNVDLNGLTPAEILDKMNEYSNLENDGENKS
jgi:hypothetical protein